MPISRPVRSSLHTTNCTMVIDMVPIDSYEYDVLDIRECCDTMREALADDDLEQDMEYGVVTIIRGGTPIKFCPWCGKPLVISKEGRE